MRLTELAWDGSFTTSGSALDEAADDFGHIVHQRPAGVLRPGSVADVGTLLRHVNGIPVVARGRGHSAYGQAQTDGIVLDMSGLADIGPVVGDRITVQAGADWRSVLTATLRHGLTPPVLTDYLGLSVGGTLSVGGIGGTSHRYGAQTDHVVAVDVTTPPGEHHACTPSDDLFHDVLAGRGRHGIITAATLNLIPAPAVVHRHQLFYAGLAALRADQHVLRHLDFVQADILPGETGWQYVLDVVADELPPTQHVAEEAETLSYFDFADRLAAGELYFRSTGEWFHPHPWWTGFLPSDAFLDQILTETTPADVGPSGLILTYPIPTAKLKTRQLAVPEGEVAVHISLLRTSTPETVAEALAANQKWQARALAAGGTGYPIGTT